MELEHEHRQIVRAYSFEVEERLPPGNDAHVLAQVLSHSEASLDAVTEPWRALFEPWKGSNADGGYVKTTYSRKACL